MIRPAVALTLGLLFMPAKQTRSDEKSSPYEARVYKSGEKILPYRLLKPTKITEGEKYPLVLFLHGAGERGNDNAKQLVHGAKEFLKPENRKKYPCFVVAPQCPSGSWWSAGTRENLRTFREKPHEPIRMTLDVLDQLCREFPVDKNRIYITGLSMGGYATWDLISRKPDLFAAAAPVCGGGDTAKAGVISKLPIWAFHGDADKAVPVAQSRSMIAAIEKAGGKPKYTEYPGVGHDSWTRTYANPEFFAWLFEQHRN